MDISDRPQNHLAPELAGWQASCVKSLGKDRGELPQSLLPNYPVR
jgi:hypothetical protein